MNSRKFSLILLMLNLIIPTLASSQVSAATYYVSANGVDTNNGTSTSTPWKTLAKVNGANLIAGDSVLFNRGETFNGTLTVAKSGNATNSITYGAYGSGANPIISGFSTVSSWANLGNNIWESTAAVSTLPTLNIVLVNGINTPMGRFPNTGFLTYQSHGGTGGSITSNQLTGTPNWTGAEVAMFNTTWTLVKNPITAHSGGTLTYSRVSNDLDIQSDNQGFFIRNDPKTLDVSGEWYYNPSTKKLRIYSTSTPVNVQVPTINTLVSIDSHDYIVLDHLSFQGSNSESILIKNSKHITVQNSDFNFSGRMAIFGAPFSTNGSQYALIENNTFKNTNDTAINISRDFDHATVRNNTITNSGMLIGMGGSGPNSNGQGNYGGIFAIGTNTLIDSNTLENIGYKGINFVGDYTIVQNNFVKGFCLMLHDGGGIYTWTGYDMSVNHVGRQVLNNVVINGTEDVGIYLDDGSSGTEVRGNTVSNNNHGIYLHNNWDIKVLNNTSYDNRMSQLFMVNENPVVTEKNIEIRNNIFFAKTLEENVVYATGMDRIAPALTANNNFYARPVNDDASFYYRNMDTFQYHSFSDWKVTTGQDANSALSPAPIVPYILNSLTGSNLVSNGTFTNSSLANFSFYNTASTKFELDATGKINGTTLKVTPITAGNNYASVSQPIPGGVSSSKKYILRFTTIGTGSGTVRVSIMKRSEPYNALTPKQLESWGTTKKVHEFLFTAPTTDSSAGPLIEVQQDSGPVYIDDIEFYETNATVTNINDYFRFEYNASDASKTVTLEGNYMDVKKTVYSGTITIAPWSSIVLMKTTSVRPPPDTIAPTVTMTNPIAGSIVSGKLTLMATASDNVSISNVDFYKDSDATPLASDTTSPYSFSIGTTTLPNGTHTFKAVVTDGNGNTATSLVVSVTVSNTDITPPTISLTNPIAGTVSGTITMSATASDNIGVASVEFWQDEDTLVGTDTTSPYSVSWNTKLTSNGTYVLTAVAVDAAGNRRGSEKISVNVDNPVVDTIKPTVAITSPTGGTVSGTIGIAATATDNIGVTKVDFYHGETLMATDTTSPYSMALSTVSFPNGTYILTAVASDAAGNTQRSTPVSVAFSNASVDTTLPTAVITSPTGGTVSGTITVVAAATDNVGVTKVEFYKDDDTTPFATDTSSSYSASLNTTTLTEGTHNFKAIAFDAAGNTKTSAIVLVTVKNNPDTDTIGPKITVTSPVAGTASGTVMYAATATDNIGVTSVEFWQDEDTLVGTDTSSPYSVSWNTKAIPNGTYILSAVAVDAAGNRRGSQKISMTVNNVISPTDTTAPTVAITTPTGGTVLGTIMIGATATDNVGVTKVDFYRGSTLIATDMTSPYQIAMSTISFPNGTYVLKAVASDAAGNTQTSTPVSVTFNNTSSDTIFPTVVMTSPMEGTVSGTVTYSATATDNIGVTKVEFWQDEDTLVGTDTTSPYSVSWNTKLIPNGTYVLLAVAEDAAGNRGASKKISITVNNSNSGTDTTAPTVSLTSPTGTRILWGTTKLSATASDNVGVAKVEFYQGTTLVGTDTTSAYSFLWNTRSVANGTYVLKAIAYDAAGNIKTSQSVTVSVKNFRWTRR